MAHLRKRPASTNTLLELAVGNGATTAAGRFHRKRKWNVPSVKAAANRALLMPMARSIRQRPRRAQRAGVRDV